MCKRDVEIEKVVLRTIQVIIKATLKLDVASFAAINGRDYAAPSTTVDSPPTRHVVSSPGLPQDAPFSPSAPSSTFDIRLLQHLAAAVLGFRSRSRAVEQCRVENR